MNQLQTGSNSILMLSVLTETNPHPLLVHFASYSREGGSYPFPALRLSIERSKNPSPAESNF